MKKARKIKNKYKPMESFKTYEEEANFWDTHNVFDFMDKSTMKMAKNGLLTADVDENKVANYKKDRSVTIRFPSNLFQKLENSANKLSVSVSTLARMFIAEKLSSV